MELGDYIFEFVTGMCLAWMVIEGWTAFTGWRRRKWAAWKQELEEYRSEK